MSKRTWALLISAIVVIGSAVALAAYFCGKCDKKKWLCGCKKEKVAGPCISVDTDAAEPCPDDAIDAPIDVPAVPESEQNAD